MFWKDYQSSILIGTFLVSSSFLVHCDSSSNTTPNNGSGLLAPTAAAKAAVMMYSCIGDDYPSFRTYNYYNDIAIRGGNDETKLMECLASKSNGCEAIKQCIGVTTKPMPQGCQRMCDGNTQVSCGEGLEYRFDCAFDGRVCDATTKKCVNPNEPKRENCDEKTFVPKCVDGVPVNCLNGIVIKSSNCVDTGLVCEVEPSKSEPNKSYAICRGTGASCEGYRVVGGVPTPFADELSCEGVNLKWCANGKVKLTDCSKIGASFSCQRRAENTVIRTFCGRANQCASSIGASSVCNGTVMSVCAAGAIESVDCTSLGFKTCDAKTNACGPGPVSP